jgi:D-methionine transport system permease protein
VGAVIPAGAGADLAKALAETGMMVGISMAAALLLGLPLGVLLLLTRPGRLMGNAAAHHAAGLAVNLVRSLPFVILLILILPLARLVAGTGTGPLAAAVPLAIASVAFYARLVENALAEVPGSLLEAAQVLGAGNGAILLKVMLPDALPALLRGFTVTAISLIGYSAMAGVVGGGGLGFLAVNYGYYRYETGVLALAVLAMLALVQAVQLGGDWAAGRVERKRGIAQ